MAVKKSDATALLHRRNPDRDDFTVGKIEADPILSLRGLGKAIWADEDPDAYVERLRDGWGVSRVFRDTSGRSTR